MLPLEIAARVVCAACRPLGELGDAAAGSLAIEPQTSAYLRDGTAEKSER